MITSISYSTDNGETWTTTNNVNDKTEPLAINVNVNDGDKVLWKGTATQTGYFVEDEHYYVGSFFSSDCMFDVQGNVMSLLYGDDFKGKTTLVHKGQFACLFSDYDGEKTCNIVNAENLSLPATMLADSCYFNMFSGCTSLTTAPVLPAETLTIGCYSGMFYGCTSLTTAPVLPAETLASYCYQYMFQDCTSLTAAPVLSATTLAEFCYSSMFAGCTSLTTAPSLPATTLTRECYSYMFVDCTSLTTAPVLPATTLSEYCYSAMLGGCTNLVNAPELPATMLARACYEYMFYGCTSLTTAPVLPATTLADACYYDMFRDCTSLVTAPELPVETLTDRCYFQMFYGCTNLNYIKAMFTTTPSHTYTENWVNGVSATGTFVKNSAAGWTNTFGINAIPTGWTVETASAQKYAKSNTYKG